MPPAPMCSCRGTRLGGRSDSPPRTRLRAKPSSTVAVLLLMSTGFGIRASHAALGTPLLQLAASSQRLLTPLVQVVVPETQSAADADAALTPRPMTAAMNQCRTAI